MRTLTSILAAGLLACSMSAIAADERGTSSAVRDGTQNTQFNNECAWGLANGKHVSTNCAVNMTGEDGKTYCFSSDKAMTAFMKDPTKHMSSATKTYGRS